MKYWLWTRTVAPARWEFRMKQYLWDWLHAYLTLEMGRPVVEDKSARERKNHRTQTEASSIKRC